MSEGQAVGKKRSRKVLILWAIALTLLLTGGAFCWWVVVPVSRVRAEVQQCRQRTTASTASLSRKVSRNTAGTRMLLMEANETERRVLQTSVTRLGGAEVAAPALSLYLSMPGMEAVDRRWAVAILKNCGQCAKPHLDKLTRDEDLDIRHAAAEALKEIEAAQERPKP